MTNRGHSPLYEPCNIQASFIKNLIISYKDGRRSNDKYVLEFTRNSYTIQSFQFEVGIPLVTVEEEEIFFFYPFFRFVL